jgi:hypothetical protein
MDNTNSKKGGKILYFIFWEFNSLLTDGSPKNSEVLPSGDLLPEKRQIYLVFEILKIRIKLRMPSLMRIRQLLQLKRILK